MAKKKAKRQTTFLDEEIDLQESYGRVEQFVENNKTKLGIGIGLISLLLIAYFWFSGMYIPGQQKEASEQMFVAQQNFEKEDYQKALDGDGGNYPGFLEIIENYSGMTDAANLAHYYAGISYLNLGKFQEAIDYLGKFKGKDEVISSMALGATGDAYLELGDNSSAISYYRKAANNSENGFSAPLYLMKAANVLEIDGDKKGARKLYEKIKKDYPKSTQAASIDKYLIRTSG